MAVPKKRHTKSRRNRRRSHDALEKVSTSICPKCKEAIVPHHFCEFCGTYKGRQVVDVLAKLTKKERKKKEKEIDKTADKKSSPDAAKPLDPAELSKK